MKKFNELINKKLAGSLGPKAPFHKGVRQQKIDLVKLFGPPFSLNLKKKNLTRADYYE